LTVECDIYVDCHLKQESELTRWGERKEREEKEEELTADVDGLWVSNPIRVDIEVIRQS